MLSLRTAGMMFLGATLVGGCGGADFSSLQGGSADGGTNDVAVPGADGAALSDDGSSGQDAAGRPATPDAGGSRDGAVGSPDSGDAGSDAPIAACPDVRGAYAIVVVEGLGCGDLNSTAPQCIRQGQPAACGIAFRSTTSGGAMPAVDGNASLENNGTFADASLTEGSVDRSGCTGSWNPATSTLTVDCGGSGSAQSCVLALKRTGAVCN
jgi:hypothetical protein